MTSIDPKLRVLIVDDSTIARRMLVAQLKELGVTSVVEAVDGADALEKLKESNAPGNSPFDLIITDLRMPNMSGSNFINQVNKELDFKNIPKLIASVETDRSTVLEAVLNGADGYILKPTTTDVLRGKLEQTFARKKAA